MVHTYLGFALDCLATVGLCVFGVQSRLYAFFISKEMSKLKKVMRKDFMKLIRETE